MTENYIAEIKKLEQLVHNLNSQNTKLQSGIDELYRLIPEKNDDIEYKYAELKMM